MVKNKSRILSVDGVSYPSAPAWIVFYNSTMIILTAFFVAYSSTNVPKKPSKPKPMVEQKKVITPPELYGFEQLIVPISVKKDMHRLVETYGEAKSRDVIQLVRVLSSAFQRELGSKKPSVAFNFDFKKNNMPLSLAGSLFFDKGKTSLSSTAKKVLKKVAKVIRRVPYLVAIQAFTDKDLIKTLNFPSNWELSSERAVSIMTYFTEEEGLSQERFVAEGFAQYMLPGRNAHDKNRRVEIVFMNLIAE